MASCALSPVLLGQGTIVFNNRVIGEIIAPVFGPEPSDISLALFGNPTNGVPAGTQVYEGVPLAGTGYTAQLLGGPAGTSESNLQVVATTVFRTGLAAGFVVSVSPNPAVPGVFSQATFQLRAWDNRGGTFTNWNQVLADPLVPRGASPSFVGPVGGGSVAAPNLDGLVSFNLHADIPPETAPVILGQPQDLAASAGMDVSFRVNPYGSKPLFYQWKFNGVDIPHATSRILWLNNVHDAHAGLYSVVVTNAFGNVTSSNAALTVWSGPPVITLHPTNQTAAQWSTVTLAGNALGSAPLFHQWLLNGTEIPSATNATLTLGSVEPAAAGTYVLRVTNAFGAITSSPAIVSVTLSPGGLVVFNNFVANQVIAPVFGSDPDDPSAQHHGNPTNGYPAGQQTYKGAALSGPGFSAQLWGGPLGFTEQQLVPCLGGLTVFRAGGFAGNILPIFPNPQVRGVRPGSNAVLQLRAWDNRGGTITNWETALADSTVLRGASLPMTSPPLGSDSASSPKLVGLTSFNLFVPGPLLLAQPTNQTVLAGSDVTFTVQASGTAPLLYEWNFNSGSITFGETVPLLLTNVQWWHEGNYAVRVSNAFGETTSTPVPLVVLTPATLTALPIGDDRIFRFTLHGNPHHFYQVTMSTNLIDWIPMTLVRPLRFGSEITDTNIVGPFSRFYRAQFLP